MNNETVDKSDDKANVEEAARSTADLPATLPIWPGCGASILGLVRV